jgi:hypothetical protein
MTKKPLFEEAIELMKSYPITEVTLATAGWRRMISSIWAATWAVRFCEAPSGS